MSGVGAASFFAQAANDRADRVMAAVSLLDMMSSLI